MFPGLNKVYLLTNRSYPQEYQNYLNVDSSSKRQEEDLIVAGFGAVPEKTEGRSPQLDFMEISDKLQYLHKTYMLGFEVTEEMYEDELYGIIKKAPAALALAEKQTIDQLAVAVLDYAFTAGYNGVDGLCLCNTAHTRLKVGGTVANRPTVDVDLDPVSFRAALQTWEMWTDENGFPMKYIPQKLLVSPPNRAMARILTQSDKAPFTDENQPNAEKEWNLGYDVLHYPSDTDAWWIQAGKDQHFMKLFWRKKPAFRGYDDPNTGNARYYVRFRLSCGFTHWPGIYGTTGA